MNSQSDKDEEIHALVRDHLRRANRDLVHFVVGVAYTNPPAQACACGFTTGPSGDRAELTKHIQTTRSIDGRAKTIRAMIRALLAHQVMEDLDGGESLFKEVWELCESDAECEVVRDELRAIIGSLLAPPSTRAGASDASPGARIPAESDGT